MKELIKSIFLSAIVLSAGFLISCTEDEEPVGDPPIVSYSSSVLDANQYASLEPGDVLSFVITVDAPAGFNTLTMNYFQNGVEVPDSDSTISKTPGTSPLEYTSDQFRFEITNEDVGIEHQLVFQAVDDANQLSNALTFIIDVTSPAARSYSTVLLAAPLGDKTGQSFFSVSSGIKYSPTEVTGTSASISPNIDFGYYYGVNNKATIASPAAFVNTSFSAQVDGWNTKNATVLRTTAIGSTQFNEATTWAIIDEIFEAGTATTTQGIASQLTAGKVVAFETVGGVRGLILVNEIIDGNQDQKFDGSTDRISIDVLAQLEAL